MKRIIISSMGKIGAFLKRKRKEKEYSLRDLEKIAGVTNPHIRNIEEEIRKPTFEVLMKLLNGLNVEAQEFLTETGYMKPQDTSVGKTKRVPVLSWVQAGNWKEVYDQSDDNEFVETSAKGEFALRVKGDSMEPEFREGDIIFLEEFLEGDKSVDILSVTAQFAEVETLILALQETISHSLKKHIKKLLLMLHQRIETKSSYSGAGSIMDAKFDALFKRFIQSANEAEEAIRNELPRRKQTGYPTPGYAIKYQPTIQRI